jgi:hypothetical protein
LFANFAEVTDPSIEINDMYLTSVEATGATAPTASDPLA